MAVPETTVYENRDLESRKRNVWSNVRVSRSYVPILEEAQTNAVRGGPEGHLGSRASLAVALHRGANCSRLRLGVGLR